MMESAGVGRYPRSPSSPNMSPRSSPRKQGHAPHSPRALYLDKEGAGSPPPGGRLRKGESTTSFQERAGSFKESLNEVNPNYSNRGDNSRGRSTLRRGESTASFRESDYDDFEEDIP